jgi:phosphomannomutase
VPTTSLSEFEEQGLLEYVDLETMYVNHVAENFDLPNINNSGFLIGYDAMYGAGQKVIKRILKHTFLHRCEYNPGFYGQAPEPIPRNLKGISEIIRKDERITVGIANDGDADRIGMFDGNGNFVDSHRIILLMIHYLHKYNELSGKVIIAFSVSEKVKKLCDAYNLPYEITQIGFKHICGKMLEGGVLLGGEESGGIAVADHIPERDGIWCGLILLEFMAKTGKTLQELLDEVYDIIGYFAYDRNDLHIPENVKLKVVENCKNDAYEAFGSYKIMGVEKIDGFKYNLGNEIFVMIRASGTEPVLRVYVEAPNEEEVQKVLEATKGALLG